MSNGYYRSLGWSQEALGFCSDNTAARRFTQGFSDYRLWRTLRKLNKLWRHEIASVPFCHDRESKAETEVIASCSDFNRVWFASIDFVFGVSLPVETVSSWRWPEGTAINRWDSSEFQLRVRVCVWDVIRRKSFDLPSGKERTWGRGGLYLTKAQGGKEIVRIWALNQYCSIGSEIRTEPNHIMYLTNRRCSCYARKRKRIIYIILTMLGGISRLRFKHK